MLSPRGSLKFLSPPLAENTEIIGPIVLNFYASTTDTEVLWFISLWDIDAQSKGSLLNDDGERLLTRGWLRGSQRHVDPKRSKPWEPFHPHTKRQPLTPGEVNEFNIKIEPIGNLFKIGHRIGLKISASEGERAKTFLEELFGTGHLLRQSSSRITLYHNADYPSHILLPITKGNIVGTFMSGGRSFFTH
jgi:predicted acyl esterase